MTLYCSAEISREHGRQSRLPLSRSLSLSLALFLRQFPLLSSPPFPRPSALWDSGTIKYILSRRTIRSPRQEGDEDGGRQTEEERAVKAMDRFGDGPGASCSEKEEDEGEVRWWRRVSGRLLERRYRGGAPNAGPRRRHQLRQCRRPHGTPPGLFSPTSRTQSPAASAWPGTNVGFLLATARCGTPVKWKPFSSRCLLT